MKQQNRRLRPFVWALGMLVLLGGIAHADTRQQLLAGLGEGPGAHLEMHFSVTIFRLDIATVEAFVSPSDASKIAETVESDPDLEDESEDKVRSVLLQADPCAIRMTLLRDASWERYLKATNRNLKHAYEAGILTKDQSTELDQEFRDDFSMLEERGVKKGDAVYYRTDGDRVRIHFFDVEGVELASTDRQGENRALGVLASYFGPKSDFSEKLIRSLKP